MGLELGWFFEQIQFLLGHASVLTTERYLGCKQNLGHPVNDLFDLKTNVLALEDSPSSATAQATPVKPLLAEQVGRRQDNGDAFRRPAPETVREEEPHRVRLDEPPGRDGAARDLERIAWLSIVRSMASIKEDQPLTIVNGRHISSGRDE